MKKAFLVSALLLGTITFTQAQPQQRSSQERAKMQSARLSEKLQLSAEQKSKVEIILLAQAKSVDSLRATASEGGDRMAMMQKIAPIRQETDKKITAVLTDDQKKAYVAYLEEMKSQMGQRDGQRRDRDKKSE